jgi:hypothetical protein
MRFAMNAALKVAMNAAMKASRGAAHAPGRSQQSLAIENRLQKGRGLV